MRLPKLIPTRDQIAMINAFLGYNSNLSGEDSEWFDMVNMTNDYFPVLAERGKRGLIRTIENFKGLAGGKNLAFVDGNRLYYNDSYITDLKSLNTERQMVMMGALLCIFPDGIIYNTHTGEISEMDNTTTGAPSFALCKMDGTPFYNVHTGDTAPESGYWIDTSQTPVIMKQYSETLGMWTSVATTYVKVQATGIGRGYKEYDAAYFEGVDKSPAIYNNYDFNRSNVIYAAGDDYLVIAGLINQTFTNSQPVTVSRRCPQMDFVCESENRIWGCSSEKHEIYACKQGDPTNWTSYAGLDSDSYAVTVGTEDDFTGCIAYNGTIYFAKENGFHKLFGNKPSNYEMSWRPGRGVQKGSGKSLCIVGNVMMYKSRDAIVMYDGSESVVSAKLGTKNMYEAVAGCYRDKYYVSMRDDNYRYNVYTYDITKGTWCKEDSKRIVAMAYTNYGLCMVESTGDVWVVNKEKMYSKLFPMSDLGEDYQYPSETLYPGDVVGGIVEDDFDWSVTSTEIGMDSPYKKYIKRLNARFSLAAGGRVKIEVMYDDTEDWITVVSFGAAKKRTYDIAVPVKRCDHMRLRISGRGEFRLYAIARAIEEGSRDD